MLLGVEHVMLDASLFKQITESFGVFYGNSTYQYRLSCSMSLRNSFRNGLELVLFLGENRIVQVLSDDRLIGRNNYYVHVVDVTEFLFLGLGSTGHARKLVIHSEIVLKCNCSKSL